MTALDDFFHVPADTLPDPRLREWRRRLEAGVKAEVELYRPATPLGITRTEMSVDFIDNGQRQRETLVWDDDINAGLIQLGVRSVSANQEAERVALGLRSAFRRAAREFGDGYFNSVLIELLTESNLTQYPEIGEVLKHASGLHPDRDEQYNICRDMLAQAISSRARELTGPLKYTEDEAKRILVQALARYLDERFSVGTRRRLGVL